MEETVRELIPRKLRLFIYLIVALIALVIGIWQQAEGNTLVFVVNLAISLSNILAAANVNPPSTIAIEDVPTSLITRELAVRNVTLQDLADQGLHLNTNPEMLPLFGNLPDTEAEPRHAK